jgi:hypothetical protein
MRSNAELTRDLKAGSAEEFHSNPWNELAGVARRIPRPFVSVRLIDGSTAFGAVLACGEGWVRIQPADDRPLWLDMDAIATWSLHAKE